MSPQRIETTEQNLVDIERRLLRLEMRAPVVPQATGGGAVGSNSELTTFACAWSITGGSRTLTNVGVELANYSYGNNSWATAANSYVAVSSPGLYQIKLWGTITNPGFTGPDVEHGTAQITMSLTDTPTAYVQTVDVFTVSGVQVVRWSATSPVFHQPGSYFEHGLSISAPSGYQTPLLVAQISRWGEDVGTP